MSKFQQKKEEFSSSILALVYLACEGITALTMDSVYRILGIPKKSITLSHAEIYLVSTTVLLIALILAASLWPPLGWAMVFLGNLRILQIISLNLLTLFFDYTHSESTAAVKRARWHFVAMTFSFFDTTLVFAFMYQFFDQRIHILNQHLPHFPDYFYYSLVTFATVGYGDIYPVTLLGRSLVCYQIVTSIFMVGVFVSGVIGRFQRQS